MTSAWILLTVGILVLFLGSVYRLRSPTKTYRRPREAALPGHYDVERYVTEAKYTPFCANCGTKNDPEYDYCSECGEELSGTERRKMTGRGFA